MRVGAALVAFVFLGGSTVHAAGNALVAFSARTHNSLIGDYRVHSQAGTALSHGLVTVGATPGTPRVSWPLGEFSGAYTTVIGPYTQYGYPTVLTSVRSVTWMLQSGMLQKSHAGAETAGTVNPSTVVTASCVDPGHCFASHGGSMMTTPNPARKYGGTALLLRRHKGFVVLTSDVGGYANLTLSVGQDLIPPFKSEAEKTGYVYKLNTDPAFPIPEYYSLQAVIGAAYTTGMITVMKMSPTSTTTSFTGSNMLNPTNLTGTISVVVPRLAYRNFTCRDFFDDVVSAKQTSGVPDGLCDYDGATGVAFNGTSGSSALGGYREIKLTFLPEPSSIAMFSAAMLALAGAARLRRLN